METSKGKKADVEHSDTRGIRNIKGKTKK